MFHHKLLFTLAYYRMIAKYLLSRTLDKWLIPRHARTYTLVPNAKTMLVIGGSFAGIESATRLAQTLPTGYKVILIERNSHMNYVFAFPRFSVVQGQEHKAFIPYSGLPARAPPGALTVLRDTVTRVDEGSVELASGETIKYEYLIIATGCAQPAPARVGVTSKEGACEELRAQQKAIERAERIAVLGGGAVGVELAADVKSYYPEKRVVLVHSRERLLNRFGERLHETVMSRLKELGVEVVLGLRLQASEGFQGSREFDLGGGKKEVFDEVVFCTGQKPSSDLIKKLLPDAINEWRYIKVHPTLQVVDGRFKNIFAVGDVADTGGVKQGRAGFVQAGIAAQNISKLARRSWMPLSTYTPSIFENWLQLTIGKTNIMTYVEGHGHAMIKENPWGSDDFHMKSTWAAYGAEWEETTPLWQH